VGLQVASQIQIDGFAGADHSLAQQNNTILGYLQGASRRHTDTLNSLNNIANHLKTDETAQLKGNATVSSILTEAGQVSTELLKGQSVSQAEIATLLAGVAAICAAEPACRTGKGP